MKKSDLTTTTKYFTSFRSQAWRRFDTDHIGERFEDAGFRKVYDLIDMRVFDLLNVARIGNGPAYSMLRLLYRYLNPNAMVDEYMSYGAMKQTFDFAAWRKAHPKLSEVTVADLVMTENLNERALNHNFDRIAKAFYHSDEYNWREYRYRDLDEYRLCQKGDDKQ